MSKSYILGLLLCVFLFNQCTSDSATSDSAFSTIEKAVEADPNEENVNKLLTAYNKYLSENAKDPDLTKPILEKALAVTEAHRPTASAMYLTGLLKETNSQDVNFAERLNKLGQSLQSQGKTEASKVIYSSIANAFPNFEGIADLKQMLGDDTATGIIEQLAIARLENPNQFGINTQASFKYVDACEAYALANPSDPKTPDYLFDAAEMAKLLRTNNKALAIYDWLIEKYPNYARTPQALFIKAFILENELKNIEEATAAYELFLEKYPENDFADDAKFSLENIGKTPDEVLKAIEERAKQNQ